MRLSDTQRRVLKWIRDGKASTPKGCKVSYRTFIALAERKLITVETTFGSIAYPQNARAWLTDAGRAALEPKP